MRAFNRHCAKRERARKHRILQIHFHPRTPRKPWQDYCRQCMTEPGWWTREFHTQPARIRANQQCRLIEMGRDPDAFLWPDGKKPHLYYW